MELVPNCRWLRLGGFVGEEGGGGAGKRGVELLSQVGRGRKFFKGRDGCCVYVMCMCACMCVYV